MYRKILATLFCVSFLDCGSARGQEPSQGNHGLGQTVSGWTHQGIHGTELASRIHQLQGKTWNTSTPPSSPTRRVHSGIGAGRGGHFGLSGQKLPGRGHR